MSAREVTLYGGSPWGFRMHGGCDTHQPLRISRILMMVLRIQDETLRNFPTHRRNFLCNHCKSVFTLRVCRLFYAEKIMSY
ncbi:hypothetical protein ALC60_09852 [Trachymyrmex zeteki]|uniref:Uncharacterized protein n=1 Tax=Mycetomoellerius zeteki TaxID=64791 RepID=A0A151WTV3_9HYME|nr:hypothetical protein ALC60_09852 [Trachymyrmex zeteki]